MNVNKQFRNCGLIIKILSIAILSTLSFLFTLNGEFVFDDSEAIINNEDVFTGPWTNVFAHDYWGQDIKSNLSHKSYRPLTTLTFRLNTYKSFNKSTLSASEFKVTNLILHTICCFVLWWMFGSIAKDMNLRRGDKLYEDTAYLATLLFALHPIHTEAVCGIVGRADLLAAITFFLSFLMYRRAMKRKLFENILLLFSLAVLATASMLCKENGVTVLGFCICYEIINNINVQSQHKNFKVHLGVSSAVRIVYILVVATVLLYGRWTVMGGTKPEFQAIDNPASFANNTFTKVATYNYIYFLNILLLVWPQWLCYDWSLGCVPLVDSGDYRLLFIFLIYIYAALILNAVFNKKNRANTKRLIITSILLATIPFLPASNIFYPVGFVIAERVLYIPSAGYCLFVTIGLQKLVKWEKVKTQQSKMSLTLFYFLLLTFGLKSWKRSEEWRNEHNLFISGHSVCPLNAKVHYNIAKVLDPINSSWAIEEYKEAIRLYPEYYQSMNNLANLLKKQQNYKEAEMYFRRALQVKRNFPAAWMNLGIVLASTGRPEEAEQAYKTAMHYRKDYVDCYYNMGNLYLQWNKTSLAVEYWLRAINSNASHALAWTNLLTVLGDTGDFERAKELMPTAGRQFPQSGPIHFAMANIYGKMEDYGTAERLFKQAIRLFGDNVRAVHYANLGVLYHRWKKYDKAEQAYRQSLRLDPKYGTSLRNLVSVKRHLTKKPTR